MVWELEARSLDLSRVGALAYILQTPASCLLIKKPKNTALPEGAPLCWSMSSCLEHNASTSKILTNGKIECRPDQATDRGSREYNCRESSTRTSSLDISHEVTMAAAGAQVPHASSFFIPSPLNAQAHTTLSLLHLGMIIAKLTRPRIIIFLEGMAQ